MDDLHVIPDETPTEDYLRLAAAELHSLHVEQESSEAMGKRAWQDILQPHVAYLVKDNWCQTAGDLRMLISGGGSEWQQLQLPARMKMELELMLMPCFNSR